MTSATAVQRDMAGGFAYPSYGCHKSRGRLSWGSVHRHKCRSDCHQRLL